MGADWVDINNHELYTPLPDDVSGHFRPGGSKQVRFAEEVNYSVDYSATASIDLTEDIGLGTSAGAPVLQKGDGHRGRQGPELPDLHTRDRGLRG